jgi:transposase
VTDLLRLKGLVATGSYEEDGFLIVQASSPKPTVPYGCCIFFGKDKNGSKIVRFRDHAIQGQPVWLEIRRQRYRCQQCKATSYEDLPDIDTERRLTKRFRLHLAKQAVEHSFSAAAKINGVHETLIRRVFEEYADRKLAGYSPLMPRVLGMDEIYLHGQARFVIGDVANKAMLDMRTSRRDLDLRRYFENKVGRENVEVVCQDMWKGYHTLTKAVFPNAVTVIDKYHVQRTANYGFEIVRKKLYQDIGNKERVALKRKRAVFLARWETCKPETRAVLTKLFEQYPVLSTAYDLKERFYDIYEADSRAAGEEAMSWWLASVPSELERPFKTSIDAVNNWRPHILRYFEHRYTSGYIERLNGLIRKMNVQGAGYGFEVLRKKALLKHGQIGETTRDPAGTDYLGKTLYRTRKLVTGIPLSTLEADLDAGTF